MRNWKIAVFTVARQMMLLMDSFMKLLIVCILFLFNSKPNVFSSDVGKHVVNQLKQSIHVNVKMPFGMRMRYALVSIFKLLSEFLRTALS